MHYIIGFSGAIFRPQRRFKPVEIFSDGRLCLYAISRHRISATHGQGRHNGKRHFHLKMQKVGQNPVKYFFN